LADQTLALAALGRVAELREVVDELEESPNALSPTTLVDPAELLRRYHHVDAATELADRALVWLEARPPIEATGLFHRHAYGRALFLAGRTAEAQRVFGALVDDNPDRGDLRMYRGFIAAMRGDTAQALGDAEWLEHQAELVEGIDRDAMRWWCRGVIFGALGDRERAMELFQQFRPRQTFDFNDYMTFLYEPMRGYPPFEELMRPKG